MRSRNDLPPLYIRPVDRNDVPALVELATLLDTLNLPKGTDALQAMTARSEISFKGLTDGMQPMQPHHNNLFMLVAVRGEHLLGTASLLSHHGTPDDPHYFLRVVEQSVYSTQLKTRRNRHLLRLERDEEPWTELGGLVVHPQARAQGIGKLLVAARLLLVAIHPEWFCERLLAELLPPRRKDGSNAFWDAVGGPLTGLNYYRADILCRHDKEFIASLFPSHEIVLQLLPSKAQAVVGQVGPVTVPVRNLLQRAGFCYLSTIDPFDGGPHFGAPLDAIIPFQHTRRVAYHDPSPSTQDNEVLLAHPRRYHFHAVSAQPCPNGMRYGQASSQFTDLDPCDRLWMLPLDW